MHFIARNLDFKRSLSSDKVSIEKELEYVSSHSEYANFDSAEERKSETLPNGPSVLKTGMPSIKCAKPP